MSSQRDRFEGMEADTWLPSNHRATMYQKSPALGYILAKTHQTQTIGRMNTERIGKE